MGSACKGENCAMHNNNDTIEEIKTTYFSSKTKNKTLSGGTENMGVCVCVMDVSNQKNKTLSPI